MEPEQNYEVTVTVRNLTKYMKRIKFSKPQTNNFRVTSENFGAVAAGLTVKLNIQFESKARGDFHDMVEIHCEGHAAPYKLNLHAFQPAADIQFEPVLNMRYIPAGETRYEQVEFRNEGRVAGFFSLEEANPRKPFLRIDPPTCQLQPDEVVSVQVGMTGTQAEQTTRQIKVTVAGQEDRPQTMEVHATSAQQTLSLVFEEGGGAKSSLNFGTLHMGERKEFPGFLINNGPQPATFKFKFI